MCEFAQLWPRLVQPSDSRTPAESDGNNFGSRRTVVDVSLLPHKLDLLRDKGRCKEGLKLKDKPIQFDCNSGAFAVLSCTSIPRLPAIKAHLTAH